MIAVLIPTLGRPEKLQPLLENIAETTASRHRTYFIAETTDEPTKQALTALEGDHVAVFGQFGSCAKAMNAGYHASQEVFVFTGNDDLWFTEAWDLPALAAMDGGADVVGVNDGHGRMTCFALARRSFIEAESGVFDRPNQLWHEYLSQYCDTELADYAKHRGVWAEAPDSVTEHRHHDFGKADPDHPNYRKARATCGQDNQTYTERRRAWESA